MKLIAGLGNPGRSYSRHRHNVGFMVKDELARRHDVAVGRKSFASELTTITNRSNHMPTFTNTEQTKRISALLRIFLNQNS